MLHSVGSARALGVGRITVFGLWLVTIALAPITLYSELPSSLLQPVGIYRRLPFDVFVFALSAPFLTGLKVALLICCALLVLGIRPYRPLAIGTCVLLLYYDGLMKSFNGYVNHAQLGMLYAATVLAVFPSADRLSVMGASKRPAPPSLYAAPMLAVALILSFAYSFIGTHRVVSNGPEIFTGDAIVTLLAVRSLEYSATGFGFGTLPLALPYLGSFFKVGFAVTTLFEVLSPLCLLSSRFRWAWLAVIIPFHVTTLLTMNIFFWENLLLILVFLTSFACVVTRSTPVSPKHPAPAAA